MKNSIETNGLYAFWKYSSFPFLLGGEVTRMDDDGKVETKEYGVGHWFRPLKLVPVKHGLVMHEKFKTLEREFRQAQTAFLDEWRRKIPEITR